MPVGEKNDNNIHGWSYKIKLLTAGNGEAKIACISSILFFVYLHDAEILN